MGKEHAIAVAGNHRRTRATAWRRWVVVAWVVAGCDGSPGRQSPPSSGSAIGTPASVPPVLRTQPVTLGYLTLKALHMDCAETCPTTARLALQGVASVYQLGVDLDHEALYVSYDRSAGEPQKAAAPMLKALRSIGFDPWFKAAGWPAHVTATDVAVLPL